MNYTHDEMLAMIDAARTKLNQKTSCENYTTREINENPRELVIANPTENLIFSQNSREVYKEEKKKRSNYISREVCEEMASSKVSDETCPLALQAVASINSSFSLEEENVSQEEEVNNIAPARTTTRGYTGISVQHAKTKKGIKISIALQTEKDAANGEYIELTGELKRHNRLRELKPYAEDSDQFAILYKNTIDELKDLKPAAGKAFCMGRMHDRGIRAPWYTDSMIVGKLNDNEVLELVIININGEEYEIPMTHDLSERQQQSYHSGGIFGELKRNRRAPTLDTAPRKSF